MSAIDLESGSFAWRVVNGEFEELKARGIPKTGAYSVGGSIATAGGLVFLASTYDEKFRAFDSKTGAIVWEYAYPPPATRIPARTRWTAAVCDHRLRGRQGFQ